MRPSNQVLEKLKEYHWPGNVRELQNILKRVLVLGNWDEIIGELFSKSSHYENHTPAVPSSVPGAPVVSQPAFGQQDFSSLESFSLKEIKKKAMDQVEKDAIAYVLEKTGWNRSKASKILRISYKTLLYKIQDLNIQPPSI